MPVAGIGVDIVEIDRIRTALTRTPRFKERVFTQEERAYCERRPNPYASYAGCFAAREAVLKALGVGFGVGIGYTDVSVGHDAKGRPVAVLAGKAAELARAQGVTDVYISIAHTHGVAVANAVAATPESQPRREEKVDEKALIAAQFKEARSLLDELDRKEG